MTLPHGQITTLSGAAALSRRLSHHRITLVAHLGRALVAEHQAESSFRVQQLLMRLRVAAHTPTTLPYLTACRASELSVRVSPAYCPLSLSSLSGSPVFNLEDSNKMR